MKIFLHAGLAGLALIAAATSAARAETRMQVAAGSTPIYAQASASAQQVGSAAGGEILFVSRIEGDWAAISPPDRLDLWLNKDFIEGNRVIAKSIQIRSGPGVQYGVVGTLERGAPVMPRGEDGDWCKIAPPSSTTLWVKKGDLSEIQTRTTPIQEVAPVPEPPKPAPAPAPAPKPAPAPQTQNPPPSVAATPIPAPQLPSQPPAVAVPPTPAPAPAPMPRPATRVAPSNPNAMAAPTVPQPSPAPAPKPDPVAAVTAPARPIATSAPAVPPPQPHAAAPTKTPRPAPTATPGSAATTLRPATALPGKVVQRPAATNAPRKRPSAPAVAKIAPTPPSAVAAQKPREIEVKVDQAYVDELDLEDLPNQGKSVQVEGELRNAPFMAGSPSRYRLQARDEDGALEMICHVHGDSGELRPYVGKGVSIRGREYWVEESDMPVVVVGQIVPLAPAADAGEDEPVMF